MSSRSIDQARALLSERLRSRRAELEAAIATRVYDISDPAEVSDPEYVQGLRASLTAAIEYGLTSIESGERRSPPLPPALAAQACAAARGAVGLDTVLRRYIAGYTLLVEFAIEEAEASGLQRDIGMRELLRGQAALFDRLIAEVSGAYVREASGRLSSAEQRRAERVKRLLSGELLDASDLGYDLDAHHLGVIASGPEAAAAIRQLASSLDRHLLLIRPERETVWAWLGSRRGFDSEALERHLFDSWPAQVPLALGEPAEGLVGWRLTHRQAAAALPVARLGGEGLVRYAHVAVVASSLRDDLLTTSLRQLYLAPLVNGRDDGSVFRATLRAYFSAGRNVSSAASALGVSRQTVGSRLRAIEERLGRSVEECAVELEIALRLDGDAALADQSGLGPAGA